jgi:hypothetical protein
MQVVLFQQITTGEYMIRLHKLPRSVRTALVRTLCLYTEILLAAGKLLTNEDLHQDTFHLRMRIFLASSKSVDAALNLMFLIQFGWPAPLKRVFNK